MRGHENQGEGKGAVDIVKMGLLYGFSPHSNILQNVRMRRNEEKRGECGSRDGICVRGFSYASVLQKTSIRKIESEGEERDCVGFAGVFEN